MESLHNGWSANQVYFKVLFISKMFKIDFLNLIEALHRIELTVMDIGVELQKAFRWIYNYKALNIQRVKYLAVAIDSEEAKQTSKVLQLLEWFAAIGLKNVCLYDTEGVLKKSKDTIVKGVTCKLLEEATMRNPLSLKQINLEFSSFYDGKEAVAKAANFLFGKYCSSDDQEKPEFTESQMEEALGAVGCGGPEPDLLLVYGPTRCHLGFPAWRIRYTEIVHMGSLDSMKFGHLVKAMYKFTMVHQNYEVCGISTSPIKLYFCVLN